MAGEEEYINPIIHSMIETSRQGQAKAQLAEQIRASKEQEKLRAHQLDLEQTKLGHDYEHQQATLKNASDIAKAMLEQKRIENVHAVATYLREGGNPAAYQQAPIPVPDMGTVLPGTPSDQVTIPGVGNRPVSSFLNASQEAERVRQLAAAKSGGEAEGALPSQKNLLTFHAGINAEAAKQAHLNKIEEEKQAGANQIALGNVHGKYAESVARINGSNHLQGIRIMNMMGLDDGSGGVSNIARNALDSLYSGQTGYASLPAPLKKAVEVYASANNEPVPTDQKAQEKKLDTIGSIQTLLSSARQIAQKYSRDSPGAFGSGNQNITLPLIGTVQRTQPGSNLESELNNIKSMGGGLATQFDQQNRKSDAEIIRSVTGVFDPKATVKQNIDKINDHAKQMQQVVRNTFPGVNPDRINKVLGDRGVTDFGAYGPKEYKHNAVDPKSGHKIGSDDGKTWFDSTTGKEVKD